VPATVSGILDRVSVELESSEPGPVTVSIQTVSEGLPSGTVLGGGTIPVSAFLPYGSSRWVDVNINDAFVTAGNQYALVLHSGSGMYITWFEHYSPPDNYPGGYSAHDNGNGRGWWSAPNDDSTFKTYVLPIVPLARQPGPSITPCFNGVCPSASGGFIPANLARGVASYLHFQERADGTVRGILDFVDSRPDGIALLGCFTGSAPCALTVTTFTCTDAHSVTVGGTYTPWRGTATDYRLTLSGVRHGPGTFSLTSGAYPYTITHHGIVDVNCPPAAGLGVVTGSP
jgi:hypothetical protein